MLVTLDMGSGKKVGSHIFTDFGLELTLARKLAPPRHRSIRRPPIRCTLSLIWQDLHSWYDGIIMKLPANLFRPSLTKYQRG